MSTPSLSFKPRSLSNTVLGVVLFLCATASLIRQIQFGGFSLLAFASLFAFGYCWLRYIWDITFYRGLNFVLGTFVSFGLFMVVSLFIRKPTIDGIQGIVIFGTFLGALFFSAREVYRNGYEFAQMFYSYFTASTWIGVTIFLFSHFVFYSLGQEALISNRGVATFVVIGLCYQLARNRFYKNGYLLTGLILFAVTASLSRTATATGLGALFLSRFEWKGRQKYQFIAILVTVLVLAYGLWQIELVQDRFTRGAMVEIGGGVAINMTGRDVMWGIVFTSALESPIWGKGAGSSVYVMETLFGHQSQPHNEYLRLFHDYGIIGLMLFLIAAIVLVRKIRVAYKVAQAHHIESRVYHLTAFVTLAVIAVLALTGNPFVYLFSMFPLGMIVGISLGFSIREQEYSLKQTIINGH